MNIIDFGYLSTRFDYIIALMMLGFILGCIYSFLILHKTKKNQHRFFVFLIEKKKKIQKAYTISMFLSIIGILICYLYLFSQVSISTFINDPNYIKMDVARSTLATYLALHCYIAIPLGVFQFHLTDKKKYLIFPVLLSLLYGMSYWGRLAFFFGLISLGISILFVRYILKENSKNINIIKTTFKILTRISFITLGAFLILTWSISFRLKSFNQNDYNPYNQKIESSFLKKISPFFGSELAMRITYGYITAPLATLNYWVERDSEYLLGQASFPYIYRSLKKIGLFEKEIIPGDENLGGGLQLPTLPGALYRDFGAFGMFIFMFFSGLLIQFFFIIAIRRENLLAILISICTGIFIIMAPLINTLAQTEFIFIIFYSIIFGKYISSQTKAK